MDSTSSSLHNEEQAVSSLANETEADLQLTKSSSSSGLDPEVAACRIQAGFRGYKTRKAIKTKENKG